MTMSQQVLPVEPATGFYNTREVFRHAPVKYFPRIFSLKLTPD
jgi:hypothetical protein